MIGVFSESIVPKILGELCSGAMTPTQHLETQQALVKQFAEILEFVLKFDEYKVSIEEFEYVYIIIILLEICVYKQWHF